MIAGKGGVGKTTVAGATALAAARRGQRALVMSLDIAHSLSDSFDLDHDLFNQNKGLPTRVADNLDLQEIDVQEEIERNWANIFQYTAGLFMSTGMDGVVAEEVAIAPGMEDIIALMYLNQYTNENTYDVIVLDCPPTAESLRFVSIFATLEWYMTKRFKMDRRLARLARPIFKQVADTPIPDDDYFNAVQRLFAQLEGVDKLLTDPTVTTVRLVTNAERMVVRESQRAYMYFSLYGITTDRIVVNRMFPDSGPFFARWTEAQATYLTEIREYFEPVPVVTLPMFPQEVIGTDRLREVADTLYGDDDPSQFYVQSPPYEFSKRDGVRTLKLKLPFARPEDVDVSRLAEDLVIRVGSFKRHIPIPRSMQRLKTGGAKMEGAQLVVKFVEP
jgi:arsenite-transporting ATPase